MISHLERNYNKTEEIAEGVYWFTLDDIVETYVQLSERGDIVHRRHSSWKTFAAERINSLSVDKQMRKIGRDPDSLEYDDLKKRLEFKLLGNLYSGKSDLDDKIDKRFISYKI